MDRSAISAEYLMKMAGCTPLEAQRFLGDAESIAALHAARRISQIIAQPDLWGGSLASAELLVIELMEVWLVAMGRADRAAQVAQRWLERLDRELGVRDARGGADRLQSALSPERVLFEWQRHLRLFVVAEFIFPGEARSSEREASVAHSTHF